MSILTRTLNDASVEALGSLAINAKYAVLDADCSGTDVFSVHIPNSTI